MTRERMTYLCLKRNAEKGIASLGQLQALDELARKFERANPNNDAAQQRALAEFDRVGRRLR